MNTNSKRIAKNTLFLYFRMLFILFITLYTSRILLEQLGIEDYGINNVVGGLATMFSFFSSSLANATQRFLNIELGRNDYIGASQIFNQHLFTYAMILILIIILAESIGLWFVLNKLVIPINRMNAAIWVYQFTILSLSITLIGIVFNSMIIAHENMKIYSYIGICEGLCKLAIAYLISITTSDKLILYSFLLLFVTFITQGFYALYCFNKYQECKIHFTWNSDLFKKTFTFIGWNMIGTAVYAINNQGINILLNLFFGPTINAARAISYQVNSAINNFGTNFFTSVRPQIVKSYAKRDFNYLYILFYKSSKYSFFLLWFFCLPVMLCINTILSIWLKQVPEFTNIFTIWVLAYSLINILTNPIWSIALAIGDLKKYILIGSGISLLTFPLGYLFLKIGYSPISVFIVSFFIQFAYVIAALVIIKRYIDYSFKDYFSLVIKPIILVILLSGIPSYLIKLNLNNDLASMIVIGCMTSIFILISTWSIGMNKAERNAITTFIKYKLRKNTKNAQ